MSAEAAAAERPPRVDILGVQVSATTIPVAVEEISRWIAEREHRYICVTGVHGVMESQRDPDLLRIHNESGLTTCDGMPLVWASRHAGVATAERVYGPDLMLAVLERASVEGWRSFFYGGAPGTPERLAERLRDRFPGLDVAGTYSPPSRPLTDEEDAAVVAMINDARPDLVWVGLSTPKQERRMKAHVGKLGAPVLLGVGAAFDIHAGNLRQAPRWMQQRGLEWLFRLVVEPKRQWRRYLSNNPRFVVRILRQPPHRVDPALGAA